MTAITWDASGERLYELGVDRGVLYVRAEDGSYPLGVPWNGLTAVTESPSGAEATPFYADNTKYVVLRSVEEFGCTIEAFTYPTEFEACDGGSSPVPGVTVGQQSRSTFGFAYRTKQGDDQSGQDRHYKIHVVYGATAAPSERAYATINDSPELITFSWEVTTDPVDVVGSSLLKTSSMTFSSRELSANAMAALEEALYGGAAEAEVPHLPLPAELLVLAATP